MLIRIFIKVVFMKRGERVEIPAAWAKDITDQFYEIKAIFDTPTFDDKVRTFCMCPHGEVTTEYQSRQGILPVNGHSNRDEDNKTENTNFAILVSTKFTKPFNDPTNYGSHIARLANMLAGGVMVQRLGDLRKFHIKTPVTGKEFQHMVKKPYAGGYFIGAPSVDIKF